MKEDARGWYRMNEDEWGWMRMNEDDEGFKNIWKKDDKVWKRIKKVSTGIKQRETWWKRTKEDKRGGKMMKENEVWWKIMKEDERRLGCVSFCLLSLLETVSSSSGLFPICSSSIPPDHGVLPSLVNHHPASSIICSQRKFILLRTLVNIKI